MQLLAPVDEGKDRPQTPTVEPSFSNSSRSSSVRWLRVVGTTGEHQVCARSTLSATRVRVGGRVDHHQVVVAALGTQQATQA